MPTELSGDEHTNQPGVAELHFEICTWKYQPECAVCGQPICHGEVGLYGEAQWPTTSEDDDDGEFWAWHLDCARAFAELMLKAVAHAEQAMPAGKIGRG